jgi:dinuclear metal center YbgI/SA1388 family protein
MPVLQEVIKCLEKVAPIQLQEEYDNSGLLCGDKHMEVTGALLTLDCTEQVVKEAIDLGFNLVVAHHPILFKGIKRFTGANYVERTLLLAIRHNIAIYACHTNLDNIVGGVNGKIADKLQLSQRKVLRPLQSHLAKLVTYVPLLHESSVLEALFDAGAGTIGHYDQCSFKSTGTGTFRAGNGSNPFIGKLNERESVEEVRLEVVLPLFKQHEVISALRQSHPYEEVAYDIIALKNEWGGSGSGLIGELPMPVEEGVFLKEICKIFSISALKHTKLTQKPIKKVAICGGSGSFLIQDAIRAGADLYLTSDVKYHEFFDVEGKMLLVDVGHFESEQFTPEIFYTIITEKFSTFAIRLSKTATNPVNYFIA